jgi:pantoate--beta-alanine ligase
MQTVVTPEAMTAAAIGWRGLTIGLVPTMGFLHAGHVSLITALRPRVDRLVVSIYVNPLQFGPTEDLSRYPRDPDGDAAKCAAAGADVLFSPERFYPDGFRTEVSVHGLTDRLCGASRPGHFEGVATVVTRLFGVTRCDVAIFGEKDFQQLQVIRRFTGDLALPVEIVPGPLVRDDDGVALSSRNVYLSPEERGRARSIPRATAAVKRAFDEGERDVGKLEAIGVAALDVDRVDYLEVLPEDTLSRDEGAGPWRVFVAAFVGRTRLIDNLALGAP